MRALLRKLVAATLAGAAVIGVCQAQTPDASFDVATRRAVIAQLALVMNERYVFPEVARRAGDELARQRDALDAIADPRHFADRLTELMQGVTHDKHIRIRYRVAAPADPAPAGVPHADEQRDAELRNNGIERVERLPGNIGYIEIRGFLPVQWAAVSITAAMTLVAHADALIVDLRRNGGGDPATVAFMSSYLFDKKTHLNDLYWREGDRVEEFWTDETVAGPRFGATKPVYVLTSSRTFSGAEEFSYNLKNLQRATLVGETTGGGANPGDMHRLSARFEAFIPEGRAVNPITRTNWEGVGVLPDVATPADRALDAAQALALARLIASQDDPARKQALQARLTQVQAAGVGSGR
jgi:C-terminal processing protease CtpA/Prc